MEHITITLPNNIAEQLRSAAQHSGVKPEDFLLISLEEKLSRLDPDFIAAMKYVLNKNEELYKRLA